MSKEIILSQRNTMVVGVLSEMNLERTKVEIEVEGKGKVWGERIAPKFPNPAMVLEVDGKPVEIKSFGAKSLTSKGEENDNFKAFETIMNQYVPKTQSKPEVLDDEGNIVEEEVKPTTVQVTANIDLNEYAKNEQEWDSRVEIQARNFTRVSEDAKHQAEGTVTGIYVGKKPEIVNEEETGREIVDMFVVSKNMSRQIVIKPHSFILPKEVVEDFEYLDYKKGDTVEISFEVDSIAIGGKTTETRGFGRKANVQKGWNKMEYIIIGAEPAVDPDEMPNFVWSMEDVGTMLKEREIMIEAEKAKKKNGKTTANGSKPKGNMGRSAKVEKEAIEDTDLPF